MKADDDLQPVAKMFKKQFKLCLIRKNPVEAMNTLTMMADDLAALVRDLHARFNRDEFLKSCGIDNEMLEKARRDPFGALRARKSTQS